MMELKQFKFHHQCKKLKLITGKIHSIFQDHHQFQIQDVSIIANYFLQHVL